MTSSIPADTGSLEADAFKKLYPETYHQKFLDDGIRPDGRTLGRSRATTIGLGTITTADGSALVKQGNTTVLAGVRLTIARPPEHAPDTGIFSLNVELAPFSSADWRPGRAPELLNTVSERLQQVISGSSGSSSSSKPHCGRPGCFPLQQLCIMEGKACWSVTLDIYILNVDGAVFDAVQLAAVAALASTTLPPTSTSPEGEVKRQQLGSAAEGDAMDVSSSSAPGSQAQEAKALVLRQVPLALTCSLYGSHVLVDPTGEEEALSGSLVTVVLDEHGQLHGLHKPGGRPASQKELVRCVESTKLRYKEVSELLQQELAAMQDASQAAAMQE